MRDNRTHVLEVFDEPLGSQRNPARADTAAGAIQSSQDPPECGPRAPKGADEKVQSYRVRNPNEAALLRGPLRNGGLPLERPLIGPKCAKHEIEWAPKPPKPPQRSPNMFPTSVHSKYKEAVLTALWGTVGVVPDLAWQD